MKILFTLIKFRNLYRVFKSFLSEISTAATVPSDEIGQNVGVKVPDVDRRRLAGTKEGVLGRVAQSFY
jgi:hypothetical protein